MIKTRVKGVLLITNCAVLPFEDYLGVSTFKLLTYIIGEEILTGKSRKKHSLYSVVFNKGNYCFNIESKSFFCHLNLFILLCMFEFSIHI